MDPARMRVLLRSLFTALVLAGLVLALTIRVVAPGLPRVVGPPAIQREQEYIWTPSSIVQLRNADGQVRVIAESRDDIEATATIRVYTRAPGLEDDAAQYADTLVAVAYRGAVLEVVTEPETRPDSLEVYVDYAIRVPEDLELVVENDNGNIWVVGGKESLEIRGSNADIAVKRRHGALNIETLNGRIRADEIDGPSRLKTVNGSIYAYLHGGSLEAETTNGAIVAHVLSPLVTACRLTSQNGGITVTLEEGFSASVHGRAQYGVVRCDFPVDTVGGVQGRQRVLGAIGSGGVALDLTTLNGNIWIARAKTHAGAVAETPLAAGLFSAGGE